MVKNETKKEWFAKKRRSSPNISEQELQARWLQVVAARRGADVPIRSKESQKQLVVYSDKMRQMKRGRTSDYGKLVKEALMDIYCRNGSFRVKNLGFTPPSIPYGCISDVSIAGPTLPTDAFWIVGNPGLLGIGGAYYGTAVSSATNFTPGGGTAIGWGAVNPPAANFVENRLNAGIMEVFIPISPALAEGTVWFGHINVANINTGVTLNELKLLKTIKKVSVLELILKKICIPYIKVSETANNFKAISDRSEDVMIPVVAFSGFPVNKEIEIKMIEYGEGLVDDTDPYFNSTKPCIYPAADREAKVYKTVMQSTGQNSAGILIQTGLDNANNYFAALGNIYNRAKEFYNDPAVRSSIKYGANLLQML